MENTTNKTITILLIATIAVSLGGTLLSLGKLQKIQLATITGYDTLSQEGSVDATITSNTAINLTVHRLNFGSGTVDPSCSNCTMHTPGKQSKINGSDTGLVAAWTFNNDENSTSNSTYSREYHNNINISDIKATYKPRRGRTWGAYHFDGDDDWIMGNSTTRPIGDTDEISVMYWFYSMGGTANNQNLIESTSNPAFKCLRDHEAAGMMDNYPFGGDIIICEVRNETGDKNAVTSTTSTAENEWYHVALTYNGSNMTIYINGEQKNATPLNGKVQRANLTVIGSYVGGNPFKGIIDTVRIYNRSLSPKEIKERYDRERNTDSKKCCNEFITPDTGIRIENVGNRNITLNSSTTDDASTFIGGTDPIYQGNWTEIEAGSCNDTSSFDSWSDVSEREWRNCDNFHPGQDNDEIELHIKLRIPDNSKTGLLNTSFNMTATTLS